ncbi:MAG: hypothetical protein AB8H80_06320 [Planctomycetota bacterium]
MPSPIQVQLESDEALVLFEFLRRFCDSDRLSVEDQAEERVLWDLLAMLEQQCPPSGGGGEYGDRLAAARSAVRDQD